MRTLIIKTDGSIILNTNTEVDLQFLQQTVGGYIEGISGTMNGWHAYVNEEGKLLGLPFNARATWLARSLGWDWSHQDGLVGDVIFLGDDGTAEERDVPDFVIDEVDRLGYLGGE